MTVWSMGDNSLYSQTKANMEPSNTFYAKNLLCLGVINKCYWKTIQSYWSYGYMQERHSHSTHTPLIEIIA